MEVQGRCEVKGGQWWTYFSLQSVLLCSMDSLDSPILLVVWFSLIVSNIKLKVIVSGCHEWPLTERNTFIPSTWLHDFCRNLYKGAFVDLVFCTMKIVHTGILLWDSFVGKKENGLSSDWAGFTFAWYFGGFLLYQKEIFETQRVISWKRTTACNLILCVAFDIRLLSKK